jgi:hypothetical protein
MFICQLVLDHQRAPPHYNRRNTNCIAHLPRQNGYIPFVSNPVTLLCIRIAMGEASHLILVYNRPNPANTYKQNPNISDLFSAPYIDPLYTAGHSAAASQQVNSSPLEFYLDMLELPLFERTTETNWKSCQWNFNGLFGSYQRFLGQRPGSVMSYLLFGYS